jgi:hypothetical protein
MNGVRGGEEAVELPGGIWSGGRLQRGFRFHPLNGAVEIALTEVAEDGQPATLPEQVSRMLAAALAEVGGAPPTSQHVHQLSVGDRHFLLRQIAAQLGPELLWLTARCVRCGQPFDVSYRHADVPVKPASAPYPSARVETSIGSLLARVPTGEDQVALARCAQESACLGELLRRILTHAEDDREVDSGLLTVDDLRIIEQTVEAMAPEVTSACQTTCPSCGAENSVPLDLYAWFDDRTSDLYAEIHALASSYHWHEAEILALPRARRHIYLALLDRSRGMQRMRDHVAPRGTSRDAPALEPG